MVKEAWHLRKELSIGTIISLLSLTALGLGGYFDIRAQTKSNQESVSELEDVPERVIRIEEQLSQLRAQQTDLKEDMADSASESRQADQMQLDALTQIQLAIARLEERLNGT